MSEPDIDDLSAVVLPEQDGRWAIEEYDPELDAPPSDHHYQGEDPADEPT